MNTKIVHVANNQVFTDTLVIAEQCELEHASVIKLVRKYQSDFEELAPCRFQIRKGIKLETGGFAKATEYAELNEDQATYLITLFRNTPIVRKFKLTLVKEFRKAINEINRLKNDPTRKDAIASKRSSGILMMEMLRDSRAEVGKETTANHYANENKFCNRALTGKWEPIDESTLDSYDLKLLEAIRRKNTILEVLHPVQKDRKLIMDNFVADYRNKTPRIGIAA